MLLPFAEGQSFVYVPFYNSTPAFPTVAFQSAVIPDIYQEFPTSKFLDSTSENGTDVSNRLITNMTIYLARNTVNDTGNVYIKIFDDNHQDSEILATIPYNDISSNGTFSTFHYDFPFTHIVTSSPQYSIGLTYIPDTDYTNATVSSQSLLPYVITASGDSGDDTFYPDSDMTIFNQTGDTNTVFNYDNGPDLGMILWDLEPQVIQPQTPVCTVSFATYIELIGIFMSIIVIILLLLILKYVRGNK